MIHLAKKNGTFYIEETLLQKLKQISKKSLVSKNKIVEQALTGFFEYYEKTGDIAWKGEK